jgi:CRISPR-associated endoribonuclease Cas6
LGNINVQCCDFLFTPEKTPRVNCTTFKELYDNADNETSICMEFLSPTTFRSSGRGERNILFPEPKLIFEGLLNRWNAYTDDDLKLHLPEIGNDTIKVHNYRLTTNTIDFGKYQETGFRGKATFKFNDSLSEECIKSLNTLADFVFYCGIGAKTTMGMGQARRVNMKEAIKHNI